MKRSLVLAIIVTFLALGPAGIALWLSRVDNHHQAVLNQYECKRDVCEADFDGDGFAGTLTVDRAAPLVHYDSWWVVVDSGKELLRLPRRHIDNTLRTHAAVSSQSGVTRITIYDHLDEKRSVTSSYAYDGHRMVEVAPSEKDREILKAMGALDDSGSFETWVLFRVFWKPALLFYYLLLIGIGWIAFRKRLRPVPQV